MRVFQEKYGPWALITGASSGIGTEFARQLAARGLSVVLAARRVDRLEALADELQNRYYIKAKPVEVDLAEPDFLSTLGPAIEGLDVGLLVNNAGFGMTGDFLDNDLDRELAMLHVNCRAPVILAHEIGRRLKQRGRGGIIFTASVMAYLSAPCWTGYAASKGHNLQYAEGLRYEMKKHGVDVLALCPGATRTEFQEVSGLGAGEHYPMMRVEPVVAAALKALGRKPAVIPGWQNRMFHGFMKILPRRAMTAIWGTIARRILKSS
jgi:short-subunit dehydrogenase